MPDSKKLLIGWAECDITPCEPVYIAGQNYIRISEYVRDPLSATVLTIGGTNNHKGSDDQVILISCDLISINKFVLESIRENIKSQRSDIDVQNIVINATHIHTGPFITRDFLVSCFGSLAASPVEKDNMMTAEQYTAFFIYTVSKAVIKSWDSRKPGKVSSLLTHAVVGHCRRVVYEDGSAKMYGDTSELNFVKEESSCDHGVELLYTWNAENHLTGVVANVACPSQVVEHADFISADFWGEVRKKIKSSYGQNVYLLALTGAAGDQAPRDLIRSGRGEPSMYKEAGLVELGNRIYNAIKGKYGEAFESKTVELIIGHNIKNVDLPYKKIEKKVYEEAIAKVEEICLANSIDKNNIGLSDIGDNVKMALIEAQGIVERYKAYEKNPFYQVEIHAVRIGNTAIITNPFELFIEYGLRMKACSIAEQTLTVQLACDMGGYLATAEAIAHGGYGTHIIHGNVGPDGGNMLVEQSVKLINDLWE